MQLHIYGFVLQLTLICLSPVYVRYIYRVVRKCQAEHSMAAASPYDGILLYNVTIVIEAESNRTFLRFITPISLVLRR